MTYEETLDYLYGSVPMFQKTGATAFHEGLHNTLCLDEHFGHPHRKYPCIHIAGTNGKGSCSHSLASILQEAGYKVGLYTSPHLRDFRERIRVNGVCIDKDYVTRFVENERAFFEPLRPSFFELTTAMAFNYFAEQQVDVAVVEVGLGGRLDCTNIITPILSVITNISIDHTQFLGDTRAKIAREKAGIMKTGIPAVVGEADEETRPVFEETASRLNVEVCFAQDTPQVLNASILRQGGMHYETRDYGMLYGELGGLYQAKNMNTILHAVAMFNRGGQLRITPQQVADGLAHVTANTHLEGRWQRMREQPIVICDTGHNVGGWQYLSHQIRQQAANHKQLRVVFGMVDDKDIHTVMTMLPKDAVYYFTKADCQRAIDQDKLMEIAETLHLRGNGYRNVKEAYRQALVDADENDFIFVGGSSYIVADFLCIGNI